MSALSKINVDISRAIELNKELGVQRVTLIGF